MSCRYMYVKTETKLQYGTKREEQQPLEHPGKDIYSEQNKKDTNLLGKHSRFARCEICICTN